MRACGLLRRCYMPRSPIAGDVLVLAPLLFQALDKVAPHRGMEAVEKRLVEVMDRDQVHDVGEVLMAPRRQLELDQRDKIDNIHLVDDCTNSDGVRERDWPWLATSRETPSEKKINRHFSGLIGEPARTIRRRRIVFRYEGCS